VTVRLLRTFGARIGERTTFKGRVYVDNAYQDQDSRGDFSNLVIGDNCYVGDGVYFDLAGRIEIEDDVVISAGASFVTHADCNRSPFLDQAFPRRCEAVRVGHGAWIGLRATLLAGARVGERTLLAAHSLLLDTAEPESLYVGAPARKARGLRP
jgi:putative colanic acid biosynthesis acetyltransferase WcaF